ncbi:hypothetical protein RB195_010791 [Necator americanus]|uniref:Reverse transcriptase RNase H-like domain-containing protein n=1 Tax=Necator americanus TaxID=51031 RepID=A0ABR1CZF5_NECAM
MDALVVGINGTAAYLDEISVTGRTIGEHNARLEAVFKRIRNYGLRVRLDKCAFLQTEITDLGFVINAEGRRSDPEKIKAIQKMQAAKDDLYNLRAPLETLKKKDAVYRWTPEMGATLSHRLADGCEKVIYHAGRCLTQPQKNYSKIEKEALALIFAVQKFHCSIQGRHFTLRTDHKPLLAIFESKEEFRSPVPSVFSVDVVPVHVISSFPRNPAHSPFHPQSNGQVESFVDTFKRGLAKLNGEEPTVDTLQTFLMAYRSPPCPSALDQRSPDEAFLGHRLRTEI